MCRRFLMSSSVALSRASTSRNDYYVHARVSLTSVSSQHGRHGLLWTTPLRQSLILCLSSQYCRRARLEQRRYRDRNACQVRCILARNIDWCQRWSMCERLNVKFEYSSSGRSWTTTSNTLSMEILQGFETLPLIRRSAAVIIMLTIGRTFWSGW